MVNEEKISKWFTELENEYNSLNKKTWGHDVQGYYVDGNEWRKWATNALVIISTVFKNTSPYYTNFKDAYDKCEGHDKGLQSLSGIFLSAKVAYENGYIFDVEKEISGEIFGDFIAMAKVSLSENHKDVAAVLASAALEDVLKRYARLNDLNVDDESMQTVVAALKSRGLVTGAQKSLLDYA